MLLYCYSNFHFDRELLAINEEVFPPGSFERQARVLATPSELSLFRSSFKSLRILSVTDFLLRVGMNLSFSYRLKRLVEVQIARRKTRGVAQRPEGSEMMSVVKMVPVVKITTVKKCDDAMSRQRHIPKWMALPFALFGVLMVVFTHKSISSSAAACGAYPECVTYAHRWRTVGGYCPCLIMADVYVAPKLYDEWVNPVDKTETVRQLALSGDLQGLRLINRRVRELPDELRHCKNMRQMYVHGTA